MNIDFFFSILVGFLAQIIDGSLGMAYGVSASSFLLSLGISPAAASASVHVSEIFTTAVSGFSHWRLKNINQDLIRHLAIPGVLGGIAGAYLLTQLDGNLIKPYVSLYLLIMGLRILYKTFRPKQVDARPLHVVILGVLGGAFDAIGGGGWGPIVTTSLIARGQNPRQTIGSVNLSEFFVTFAISATFISTIGLTNWHVILGLILGGVIAAPFGAIIIKRIHPKPLTILVGVLIIVLSLRTIYLAWG